MRVVHISKITGIAGSEGHLLRLLPGLAAEGIEPHMIVLEYPRFPVESFHAALAEKNITTHHIPISRYHVDLSLSQRLEAVLKGIGADVVHTHLLHADFYALEAARRVGVHATVSSRHNDDKFRRNRLIQGINQRAMRFADRVIAISDALAGFVRDVEGIPSNKVVTIRYGLEAPAPGAQILAREIMREELGYSPAEPLIGIFGRLIEQKGVDVLLHAFAKVRETHTRAKLMIVGNGKDRAKLEELAASLGLGSEVRFLGWVNQAQRLMPACDVITVPSRWEGFGLVTLEAMGWARPLIASQTSSLPEIILDGVTGLLVPTEDYAALAAAIDHLLSEPEYADKLGQAGYARLTEEFSVEKMVCATLDLYREITT